LSAKAKDGSKASASGSSSKKIIIYAAIGILAVIAVAISITSRPASPQVITGNNTTNSNNVALYREQFCGAGAQPLSNDYIHEMALPSDCEMPLGMFADGNTIWYVSTKQGLLGSYDTSTHTFGKEYLIPSWPPRSVAQGQPEMAWDIKGDKNGNLWLATEFNAFWKFNKSTGTFSTYKTPTIYPDSFEFDKDGNLYFTGFFAKSLWFADVAKMKNGTSDGISEIPLPLDAFKGIQTPLGSGSLTVDNSHHAVWLPVLAFEQKGIIFRYDMESKEIKNYTLPGFLQSPSSTTLDSTGRLWVTDHATSTFFSLDPDTGNVTSFVTSMASTRLFDGQSVPDAYTLPYWVKTASDGTLWLNEHEGNQIAHFDPSKEVLVEYWIPTQNKLWSVKQGCSQCGVANALQFTVDNGGQVWFSEWTQNNIAQLDGTKPLPISISTSQTNYKISHGQSLEVKVKVSASSQFAGEMISSSSITPTATLGNATGTFSEPNVSLDAGSSKQLSYVFNPSPDLKPGNYTLMLGASNDQVSYLQAVHITLTS
jgi:virginiamycin B lyase